MKEIESDLAIWMAEQKHILLKRTIAWSTINSGSMHFDGIQKVSETVQQEFLPLHPQFLSLALPERSFVQMNGSSIKVKSPDAMFIQMRPESKRRILLCGHLDTVFAPEHSFQVPRIEGNHLIGPGVVDMKGGIAVLLTALEALERFGNEPRIGWDVLLTTDEEIGSPGSSALFRNLPTSPELGLIFEPSYPDGRFVGARKGSVSYTLKFEGKASHAGRNYDEGKSAIFAIAEIINQLESISPPDSNTTINVGMVQGGNAVNIVPDLAVCKINIRSHNQDELELVELTLQELVRMTEQRMGIKGTLSQDSRRPAKPLTPRTLQMLKQFQSLGKQTGQMIDWVETGGCCDGNNLQELGIPVVDTLGPIGGHLHTDQEYLEIDSLSARAHLAALFLIGYSNGEISFEASQ